MKKTIGLLLSGVLLFALGIALQGVYGHRPPVAVAEEPPSTSQRAAVSPEEEEPLPVVGSYPSLKKLLKTYEDSLVVYETEVSLSGGAAPVQEMARVESMKTASAPAMDSADFSVTNVQVQGVDEADVAMTDGTYLYQATPEEVRIIRAQPVDRMEVVSRISYADQSFHPLELYLDEKRLVVIGHSMPPAVRDYPAVKKKKAAPALPPSYSTLVQALVYDVTDKSAPRLTRTLEADGHYVSSRKIGSNLYLVTNKPIDSHLLYASEQGALPIYRDSAQGNAYQTVRFDEIRYFPEIVRPEYLIAAGANLDDPKQPLSIHTYLGAGENVYASPDHLYVALTGRQHSPALEKAPSLLPSRRAPAPPEEVQTTLYRFSMKAGTLSYTGKGSVPGRLLNQFSMDEHEDHLRIATTTGDMWRTDEGTSKNNLYVLDNKLKLAGVLEGIAPGEKIYAVRFMGDRAYMVTFKQVDPLFVIDVRNPAAPQVLGALKIPGYSDYLHPYDENHIIGFGKDAVADKETAFYQGMKLALFDVTDVNNPREKFQTVIGDRGTDSELLRNHKALLFSKEKELLAFPVSVHTLSHAQKAAGQASAFGDFSFQGAYVYRLNKDEGFALRGRITHLDPDDLKKAGHDWYDSAKNIERIIYIGDTLYTLSRDKVKANNLQTLTEYRTLHLSK